MKKFNINDYIYIKITESGWEHLQKTCTPDYITHCIKSPYREVIINNESWHKLQMHVVFEILSPPAGGPIFFETTIMFDENDLI